MRMKRRYLTLRDRQLIELGIERGLSLAYIANGLGFCRSTVSREVAQYREPDGSYSAREAHRRHLNRIFRKSKGGNRG